MLAANARLRSRDDFARTVSRGRRATRGVLAVHVAVPHPGPAPTDRSPAGTIAVPVESTVGARPPVAGLSSPAMKSVQKNPVSGDASWPSPRAGFVVSRSIGGAVQRNRVRRRLRHLTRDRLASLPPGTDVVVRALSGAASRSFAELGVDLDLALAAAVARKPRDPGVGERGPR